LSFRAGDTTVAHSECSEEMVVPEAGDKREEPRFDGVAGLYQGIGLPGLRTPSDANHDTPEPTDSSRVPTPEPPGPFRRIARRLPLPHGDSEPADR
jgi:hypothetical protein